MNTHIIMLHGLGAHPITFKPMELYLNYCGWINIHNIYYPVDTHITIQESLDYIDEQIRHLRDEPIIVIGQSMGGVIGNRLHTMGYSILFGIYIGSPLQGANLLNQIDSIIPRFIRDKLHKPPYDILMNMVGHVAEEPPHDYRTISMGWFWTNFDGCVYRGEAMMNSDKHIHLSWADHRTIFANPRLWYLVENLLRDSI